MKTINEFMTRATWLVSAGQTIAEAAAVMREQDIGSVAVQQDGELVGMLTDRDIAVRATAKGLGPDTLVCDVMTRGVKYCFDDEAASDVAANMARFGIRRLPVLDRSDRLVGFISLSNMALSEDPNASVMNGSLTEPRYSSAALMKSVCHPHPPMPAQPAASAGTIKVWLQPARSLRVPPQHRVGGVAL